MKKFLLLTAILSYFATCNPVLAQTLTFPKSCLKAKKTTTNPESRQIGISTSKADIHGIALPINLMEYQYANKTFSNQGTASVGLSYIIGGTNFEVKADSTVLTYGTLYEGLAALYRTDASGTHYIFGLLLGYDVFAVHLGGDFLSTGKAYPEASFTINLLNVPFVSNLISITPR